LANELGCKYANDPERPVRSIASVAGGLITQVGLAVTCNDQPMAGMWIHNELDTTYDVDWSKDAITRAMVANGCTIGTSYDTATFEDYPIGGGNAANTCKKILGCPDRYPLVMCAIPGVTPAHSVPTTLTEPGITTFLSSFFAP
jgi:hypothetical protein